MNSAFKSSSLEFRGGSSLQHPVRDFLVRFNAIFTLNQDILLEHCYRGIAEGLVERSNPLTQRSWQIPGMRIQTLDDEHTYPAEAGLWVPTDERTIASVGQPIFKLHGSSNWRTGHGSSVMILGGGKIEAIARFPVLRWYTDVFADRLSHADARLMIIGYGFRDDHINTILELAIGRGLKVFVIDPRGADAGDTANRIPKDAIGYEPTRTQEALMEGLIGASQRWFSSTFSVDYVERQKVERIFYG